MAGFSMSVAGLAETIGKLVVMEASVEVKATEAVTGATQDALDASLPLIAVRTGYLLEHQQKRMVGSGMRISGELFNDAPYSRWECFGHHTHSGSWVPGQDFMTLPIMVGQKSLESRLGHIFF
jgi:hypothetical protein